MSGSYVSGLENVTLHLLRGLKESGYQIECIISGWNDGVLIKRLDDLEIHYHEVKLGWIHLRKPLWTIDTLINYPKAYAKCKKIIKDFQPDILNFCNYFNPIMIYGLIRHKSVYSLHESHLPSKKHLWIYKRMNKKINIFTAVSKHIFKIIEQLNIPSSKIRLVYNGIPAVNKPSIKEIISADKSIFIFAIVGQVIEWKGHLTVIDAVEILIKDNGALKFIIQIFGNDANIFALKVKDIINKKNLNAYFEWKGFINNQDEIYDSCDAVLVPSLSQEPCSLTIIEAMARGKAVIASDRGGNPELIQHKKNGLIFSAEDAIKLGMSMLNLIKNKNIVEKLGFNAANKAFENFSYHSMTNEYIKIYQEL